MAIGLLEVDLDEQGLGRVAVDGKELAVTNLDIHCKAGKPTVAWIRVDHCAIFFRLRKGMKGV